jgi:hypothetical protein
VVRHVLAQIDYAHKDTDAVGAVDAAIGGDLALSLS